jgi:hypothetical protein
MSKPITFKIADISVTIAGDLLKRNFKIPQSYNPFMGSGKTDIYLRLLRGNPEIGSEKEVFKSLPIWTLYRSNGQSIIKMYAEMPQLARTMVFDPEFKNADLYFPSDSDCFIEPFFGPTLELLMINYLAQEKGVIIHGCGIAVNRKGMLFVGESGAGKSTIARMWDQQNPAEVLSDDRTILRKKGNDFRMYGTPWHGEAKFGAPNGVKLEKIFFLHHGQDNTIQKINKAGSVQHLLTCSFPPFWDSKAMEFIMDFFSELADGVACYDFFFKPDISAVDSIRA